MKEFFEEKLEYFAGGPSDPGYWDYNFIDVNPSHGYAVTYSESDDGWYGHVLTNVTPDGDWEASRELTPEEIAFCIELITLADLPSILLASRLDVALARNVELEALLADWM